MMLTRLFSCLVVLCLASAALAAPEGEKVKEGLLLMKAGDYEGALSKFRDAQIDHPGSHEVHFNIGMALYKLERYEEARKSFESAAFSSNQEIEKKALFHIGNCFVKEGKLEPALGHFNRALQIDEDFDVAKVNREYVVRKMKELARKQKEQQEKQEQDKRIIEKVQALLQKQISHHALLRWRMKQDGEELLPTTLKEFAQILDGAAPESVSEQMAQQSQAEFLDQIGKAQDEMKSELDAIIDEVTRKLEAAEAAQGGQGGVPPQGDPEIPKLTKALPHLQSAQPKMARAREAAVAEHNLFGTHAGQEGAVQDLVRALNELLDELARLIKDEAALLADTFAVDQSTRAENEDDRPGADDLKATGESKQAVQQAIRDRTERFAKGMVAHLEGMKQQLEQQMQPSGMGGQGVQPGQDPKEGIRRMEKALSHINNASGLMEEAEAPLKAADFKGAIPKITEALQQLVKARAALSPPQQQQGNGDKEKQGDKKQDPDQKDGDEQKESKKQQKGEAGEASENEQQAGKQKKAESQEISEEQARKTLDQHKQREMDRRRAKKEKQKKGRGAKGRGVKKDW